MNEKFMKGFPMTVLPAFQVLTRVDRKSDLMAVHTCGPVLSFTLPSPCTGPQRLPRPSQSMHFGDVSKMNGWEMPTKLARTT